MKVAYYIIYTPGTGRRRVGYTQGMYTRDIIPKGLMHGRHAVICMIVVVPWVKDIAIFLFKESAQHSLYSKSFRSLSESGCMSPWVFIGIGYWSFGNVEGTWPQGRPCKFFSTNSWKVHDYQGLIVSSGRETIVRVMGFQKGFSLSWSSHDVLPDLRFVIICSAFKGDK